MKRIVICGAGEVGRHSAEVLVQQGHRITFIDVSQDKLNSIEESLDVTSIRGSSCQHDTLQRAHVNQCDALIAATNSDEINLLTSMVGKKLGAKRVVARIQSQDYFETERFSYKDNFGIDCLIYPAQLTSDAITASLLDPGDVEIEHFAHNQIEMHRYRVDHKSKVLGPNLSQLNLPMGMRLAVIERNGQHFVPSASTLLATGDIVTLIGKTEHFQTVKSLFAAKHESNKNVAIMGGTHLAECLMQNLTRLGFTIRLFETDRSQATDLAERYPMVTVVAADPSDPDVFRSEDLSHCSAFISMSQDDEHNILAALQAKQFGVGSTMSVIHSPTYLNLLTNLGIDFPFSPRVVAAKQLLKFLDDSPIKTLAVLAPDVAQVYQAGHVGSGSGVGRSLREVTLPKGPFVAAIQRQEKVIIPTAEDIINQGDILVIIGPPGMESYLTKSFRP